MIDFNRDFGRTRREGEEAASVGVMRDQQRSRANLRSPSRSAWVIDRLLKNQNPLEKRNTLRSPSPLLVVGRRPENRAAILRPKFIGTGADSVPIPRPDASRAGWRLRQSHHRLQRSLQPVMTPVPSRYFRPQNRGAVIQALPAAG